MLGQPYGKGAPPIVDRLRDERFVGQSGMRLEAADEIDRLRKLIAWCRPRLKQPAYRTLLDRYLDNPGAASEWDDMKIVQSDRDEQERDQNIAPCDDAEFGMKP